MAKTLEQVTAKWAQNAGAAQTAYTDGIRNTTVDPTALAAANEAGYLSGVQQAVQSGLWRQRLAAGGKQGWQDAAIAKAGSYGTGISVRAPNLTRAMQTWHPIIQQAGAAATSMPRRTVVPRPHR